MLSPAQLDLARRTAHEIFGGAVGWQMLAGGLAVYRKSASDEWAVDEAGSAYAREIMHFIARQRDVLLWNRRGDSGTLPATPLS